MTEGQRAYEAKRDAKAVFSLDKWLAQKEKQARAEREAAAGAGGAAGASAPGGATKKPGFFARLLERAQKPL